MFYTYSINIFLFSVKIGAKNYLIDITPVHKCTRYAEQYKYWVQDWIHLLQKCTPTFGTKLRNRKWQPSWNIYRVNIILDIQTEAVPSIDSGCVIHLLWAHCRGR